MVVEVAVHHQEEEAVVVVVAAVVRKTSGHRVQVAGVEEAVEAEAEEAAEGEEQPRRVVGEAAAVVEA